MIRSCQFLIELHNRFEPEVIAEIDNAATYIREGSGNNLQELEWWLVKIFDECGVPDNAKYRAAAILYLMSKELLI